ncbi:transcriptional regulator with XRE-family HTH domain [Kribbella sp. VKM Ac-2571]|uniref:helix-turn-helix domain-containing protein n=1 Tax=Kribbella sp. VKM Ac-2571 TaxID=2512222 RepID=UPI00105F2ABA|nr:pyridoxamine 5'-phosphate oxidase family protein [Kribbella sp. VKM Ac-2571]TDO48331.1 transcriptional regulator with XRE-family HTH domain [Kribbella sp. VKM Ac-2571]
MDAQTNGRHSDLGTRIRHRRQSLGLTLAEVAIRTGLDTGRIDHIETRPFALTGAELARLAHALDLTVTDLTSDRPKPDRRTPVAPALDPMRKEECRRLIEAGSVGRIAYHGVDGLVVIPVNYCTLGELIVFRTAADSAVAQYDLEPIVFELDAFDEAMHDGWSVMVNGTVRPAVDTEIASVHDRVEPWAGGTRDTYMVIDPHRTTGRRIRSW